MSIEKIKNHLKEHYKTYLLIGGVAGITAIIMRSVASQPISHGIASVTADRGIASVIGEKAVLNNVSFINSNRQGSPSWVIRCLDNDEVFTSQRKAAAAMDISPSELSQHLNGLRNHVGGYTFERICMAA